MKVINSTPNGQITYCEGHQCYHLEFGNVFIHLSKEEIEALRTYIGTINPCYYEQVNQHSVNRRKILLNLGTKHLYMSLSLSEFMELKELLTRKTRHGLISNRGIIGSLVYN